MKLFSNIHTRPHRTEISAFTLVEMMVSVGIYLGLFVGVMIAIQIFGLRVYILAATKLTSTADGRKAMNQIRDDIRQAKTLQVGNTTGSAALGTLVFTPTSGTNWAQGNALQVFSTTNQGAPYNIYYLELNSPGGVSSNNLIVYQVTSNSTLVTKLTGYITNSYIFDAEDFQGNIVTNSPKNNQVYGLTLQFYQWEFPIAFVGSGTGLNEYNYYQLRTKVCRRALD
jgi:type II secretory pathway pseudopilin PulG